jgi:hypothetical protein
MLALTIALLPSATGRVEALSYISVEMGQLFLWNPGNAGEVSPVLLWAPGAIVPIIDTEHFRVELGALVWGTQYEYLSGEKRMVPTQIETARQIGVLGLLVTPLAGVHFALAGGRIELGAAIGPSVNLRFPVFQTDSADGGKSSIGAAYAYFWAARFFFPESRLWIRWYPPPPVDDIAVSLSVSAFYPIFQAWYKKPFLDQFTVAVIAGFDFRLGRKKAAAVAPAQAPAEAAPAEGGAAATSPDGEAVP